ncbi:MAG TPA: hypothetical protein PLO61_03985 [Fimbriimonadaceae bacterium]|nr:hypothetical protein [Fimbriimonadaceae bacterium]HRJ32878.1 hypothetical protein [Fimbriimonadaceae bacterium]
MLKKILIVSLASVALLAFAQTPGPRSHGQGLARKEGQNFSANFRYEVAKVQTEQGWQVRGRFRIAFPAGQDRPGNVFEMRPDELGVNSINANFAGNATRVVQTANGNQTIQGRLAVRAEDRRNPQNTNGPRDRITIRFVPANNQGQVFEWQGLVVEGNLVVLAGGSGGGN